MTGPRINVSETFAPHRCPPKPHYCPIYEARRDSLITEAARCATLDVGDVDDLNWPRAFFEHMDRLFKARFGGNGARR